MKDEIRLGSIFVYNVLKRNEQYKTQNSK